MHELASDPAADRTALSYPFDSVPSRGQALAVAPGVLWLRMRLPMAGLDHINVWALEDAEGWTLADTGMQMADTAAAWQSAFAGPLQRRPVKRGICTHTP